MISKLKKGQVTLFVIFGLLILAAIAIIVSYKSDTIQKIANVEIFKPSLLDLEVENVEKEVQSCVTDVLEGGLFLIGLQGGYISLEDVKYTNLTHELLMPYWPELQGTAYSYYGNTNKIPSVQTVTKSLTSYLDKNVPQACKTDREGVTYGIFKSEVLLKDTEVLVNINWDVTVKKDNVESKISKMIVKSPVRLKVLLTLLKQMVDDQMKASKEKLCLSCWGKTAASNNIELKIRTLGKDTLFFLLDSKSEIAGGDYPFMLALMLDEE